MHAAINPHKLLFRASQRKRSLLILVHAVISNPANCTDAKKLLVRFLKEDWQEEFKVESRSKESN
jgi:hypothetical protein